MALDMALTCFIWWKINMNCPSLASRREPSCQCQLAMHLSCLPAAGARPPDLTIGRQSRQRTCSAGRPARCRGDPAQAQRPRPRPTTSRQRRRRGAEATRRWRAVGTPAATSSRPIGSRGSTGTTAPLRKADAITLLRVRRRPAGGLGRRRAPSELRESGHLEQGILGRDWLAVFALSRLAGCKIHLIGCLRGLSRQMQNAPVSLALGRG